LNLNVFKPILDNSRGSTAYNEEVIKYLKGKIMTLDDEMFLKYQKVFEDYIHSASFPVKSTLMIKRREERIIRCY
jgi:hypothetical protein